MVAKTLEEDERVTETPRRLRGSYDWNSGRESFTTGHGNDMRAVHGVFRKRENKR